MAEAQSTCRTCARTKPVASFYVSRGNPSAECRTCTQVRAKRLPAITDTKQCSRCQERKPLAGFYRNGYGQSHVCKDCTAESRRKYRADNAEKISAQRKAAYRRDLERNRQLGRERYRRDPVRAKIANWRFMGIDISVERYHEMHRDQDGHCKICGRSEAENGKALAVDHDHSSGRVRGLLCDDCNIALGRFQDSPDVLRRAIDYLSTHMSN